MEEFLMVDLYDTSTMLLGETCTIPGEPEDGFSEEHLIESIKMPERPHCSGQGEESFEDLKDLKQQRLDHPGEKTFVYDQCDKRFNRSESRKHHPCTHIGEKPYTCDQCDKRFSQSRSLKTHQRIHTRERPYTCDQRDKTFGEESELPSTCPHRRQEGRTSTLDESLTFAICTGGESGGQKI